MKLTIAVALGAFLLLAGVARADSIQGTLFDREHYDQATGEIVSGTDGFSGAAFYDPNGLNTGAAATSALARDVMSADPWAAPPPAGQIPAGSVFAGLFEFEVDSSDLLSSILNPSQKNWWLAEWTYGLFSGPGENTFGDEHSFSTTVYASWNDFVTGWVSNGSGEWVNIVLYDDDSDLNADRGFFRFASDDLLTAADTWWTGLNGASGTTRYAVDDSNSALIVTGGSFQAQVVPLPGAAVLGLGLLGTLGVGRLLRRRRIV